MIHYIKGELVHSSESEIIVENNGIGYVIEVPLSVLPALPAKNQEIKIYTELYVREDILKLFGFLTRDDLEIFRMLITVSGIGPKGALAILSLMTPEQLRFAILANDVDSISAAKGIGKKTASKLVIELQDKLRAKAGNISNEPISFAGQRSVSVKSEAVEALVGLGYSVSEATAALKKVADDNSLEDMIKLGLRYLSI
ncbi:Holliday junction branch migration protein RuvA [Clostridiales bacterium COT073_COT-073]|nr:Holliday junction branch migration protein RuvA [Clostridiales bacterium COT073_COT-073]